MQSLMTAVELYFQYCDCCSVQYRRIEAKSNSRKPLITQQKSRRRGSAFTNGFFWMGGWDLRVMQSFFE